MTRLENRLRAGLDELAATVPPSANAVAEHNRRVAATNPRRRRPMLAAAAAAVVIAGVIAPSALSRDGGESIVDDGVNAVSPATTVSVPTGVAPGLNDPYGARVTEPVQLATFTEGGREWVAFVSLERTAAASGWAYRLCVLAVPAGAPADSTITRTDSSGCTPVHEWPHGQPPSKVETRSVFGGDRPGSGPLPGLLLFVTAPEVTRLDVRAGDGRPVAVRQIMRIPELTVFLADFGTSQEGFGYDALDAAGTIVESGIT